jgi:hypothetical protein
MPNLTGDDLQTCGSPSKNSVVLGSSRAEGRKGEKRGESGLFIGADEASFYCLNQWDLTGEERTLAVITGRGNRRRRRC